VDEDGRPKVVYHGTDKDFTKFKNQTQRQAGGGFFFTSSAEQASDFSGVQRGYNKPNVMPVHLALQNPKTVDFKGQRYSPSKFEVIVNNARKNGNDGVIIKNVTDRGGVGNQYIAFEPTQIKSATGNRGTFSPDNPDIRFSLKDPESVDAKMDEAISYNPGAEGPNKSEYLSAWERFKTAVYDEFTPISKIQKFFEEEKGRKVTDDENLIHKRNRALGYSGTADLFVEERLAPIYQGGGTAPGTKIKLTPNESRALNKYLIAKRMKWLYENWSKEVDGKEQRFSDKMITKDMADKTVEVFEKRGDFKEKYEPKAKAMWDYHKTLSQQKQKVGVWTADELASFTQEPFYVPLIRDFEKVKSQNKDLLRKDTKFTNTNKLVRFIGPESDLKVPYVDPLSATIYDTHQAMKGIAHGLVWNGVIDLVERTESMKGLIEKVPHDYEPLKGEGTVKVQRKIISKKGKERVELVNYKVPVEIEDAIVNLGAYSIPDFMKFLTKTTNFFRKAVIQWNPGFFISNLFRDQQDTFLNTGKLPGGAVFKGLYHYLKKDDIWKQYQRYGGSMNVAESGMKGGAKSAEDIIYPGKYDKVKDAQVWDNKKLKRVAKAVAETLKYPIEATEFLAEASEMLTRLGVFEYGLKNKMTMAEAVNLARNSTIDFQKFGSKIRGYNQVIPFLNAGIQGTARMAKSAKDNPAKFGARAALAVYGPTAVLMAWNMQNEHYAEIDARTKDYNWIIMLGKTGKEYIKIPKGHIARAIQSPFQLLIEKGIGTAQVDYDDILSANPLTWPGSPVDHWSAVFPPLIKVPLEQIINRDLYWGQDIVQYSGMPQGYQYNKGTAETLKLVGKYVNVSPERLQHVMKGFMGGTAQNILYLTDVALGHVKPAHRSPVSKRMYGIAEEWRSDLSQKLREKNREIREHSASKRKMVRQYREGDKRTREKWLAKKRKLNQEMQELTRARRELKELMARMR